MDANCVAFYSFHATLQLSKCNTVQKIIVEKDCILNAKVADLFVYRQGIYKILCKSVGALI